MARILLLDDDPVSSTLAVQLLGARGHHVDQAMPPGAPPPELVLCTPRHPGTAAWLARKAGAILLLLVAPGEGALRERLLGQGADGYIGLPLEAASFAEEVEAFLLPAVPAATSTTQPQTRPALLLVDDDPFMLAMLEELVRDQGWRVLTAASGEDALARLAREHVAVVLSDHCMPGMSGAELLAAVRARDPACARLLLSGQREDAAIAQALRTGDAERFLAKPWHGATLLAALHEAFRLQRGRAG